MPLLLAHNAERTLGVFWLNASETFVNVRYDDLLVTFTAASVHSSPGTICFVLLSFCDFFVVVVCCFCHLQDDTAPLVDRRGSEPQTELHLLSESGIIDCVVLLGPSPQRLFTQYGQLTGLSFKIYICTKGTNKLDFLLLF